MNIEHFDDLPSRESVKRAGKVVKNILKDENTDIDVFINAIDIISKWRAFHAIPMNSLRSSLRHKISKIENNSEILISRRLKRMPSIINKIDRMENMGVSNMQDIAGVRVILPDMDCLQSFKESCDSTYKFNQRKKQNFVIEPIGNEDKYNYIENPKRDGYRSIHQVYRFQSSRYPQLKNMKVELQIRTHLQHCWATAVETLGLIIKSSLKTGEGEDVYKRFFLLCSALFSYEENTPIVESIALSSKESIIKEIRDLNDKIKVTDKLAGTTIITDVIQRKAGKNNFYLIKVDLESKTVSYFEFSEEQMTEAEYIYKQLEKEVSEDKKNWEVALISIDSIDNLRKTYPNYYLDATSFLKNLNRIIN